jgi:RTX calcium-binding nonapeptide repeat (4 copies)
MRGLREGWSKHPWEWLLLLAVLALLVTLALAPRAHGAFGQIMIRELKPATTLVQQDGFIEFQMYAPDQTELQGHYVRTYDVMGSPLLSFQFPGDVANGDTQRTILVADSDVGNRDFLWASFSLPETGGALCLLDHLGDGFLIPDAGVDCVSWGNFDGSFNVGTPSPVGSNAPSLLRTSSLERSIAGGCPTLLEASDDTDDSGSDFALQPNFSPHANSVTPTEHPCPPGGDQKVLCGGRPAGNAGSKGADLLKGTAGRDVIAGRAGNDIIRGRGGNDVLCGGGGRDRLIGGGGRDRLLGQAGRDVCKGGPKKDTARTCEVKRTI